MLAASSFRSALVRLAPLSVLATSCDHSSSESSSLPTARVTNLGLALDEEFGAGELRCFTTSEESVDSSGDGDVFDKVVYVVDLAAGSVTPTGVVVDRRIASNDVPLPFPLVVADSIAFGVSESNTGRQDRNGDGDVFDAVLARYERATGDVINLGIAVGTLLGEGHWLAFDVPEGSQGEDLDGNGVIDPQADVPHVHDLSTGATINTGIRGARVVALHEDSLALVLSERQLGDQNGDGDDRDAVYAFHDLTTGRLVHSGMASPFLRSFPSVPVGYRGGWAIHASEEAQGADLNADGDARDSLHLAFDLTTGALRDLGAMSPSASPDSSLLVAQEIISPGVELFAQRAWIFDPRLDRLESTGFANDGITWVGDRLALLVEEIDQQEDLDRDGRLESHVVVLYEPASGRTETLGVSGSPLAFVDGILLLQSQEREAGRDWNADGDQDDTVLWTWDEVSGALVNTGIQALAAVRFGSEGALVVLSEFLDGADYNGDGDLLDGVSHRFGPRLGRLESLGLAVAAIFPSPLSTGYVAGDEASEGRDLNGDGDAEDAVLHLVQLR